jgi:hypothetical protein
MPGPARITPALLSSGRRSRLTRLAGELEDRHGPGRAAPGAPESLIDRAARKLAESRGDLAALDFAEKKAVLELLWRPRQPWIAQTRDIENWLRWAETGWKPRIAETRICIALLRHYDPDNPAAELTQNWLSGRQAALWGRFGEFARAWRLWRGPEAVSGAAEALASGDLAFLSEAGRNAQTRTILQNSGFLVAVAEAYALRAAPANARQNSAKQTSAKQSWSAAGPLLDFFEPAGLLAAAGPAAARARAKLAFISGLVCWAVAHKKTESVDQALKLAFRIAGDPRAGLDDWRDIPDATVDRVERWLAPETVETSFRIVAQLATEDAAALERRRAFWRGYLPFVARARLIGARKAQAAAAALGAPCCALKTYLSDHCGFVAELRGPDGGKIIVLELNNLAQTLFWSADDPRAPGFDQRAYDGGALRAACDLALSHLPALGWTEKFAALIAQEAGLAPVAAANNESA